MDSTRHLASRPRQRRGDTRLAQSSDDPTGRREASGATGAAAWLLLLNHDLTPAETVAALRAAVPSPWERIVLLSTIRRWWPLGSGVPLAYRAERRRALRSIWDDQEASVQAYVKKVSEAIGDHASALDLRLAWGEPAAEAHRLARESGASMIVYCVKNPRGLLSAWPGSLARRLTRNAPCSVLLARLPGDDTRFGSPAVGAAPSIPLRSISR